MPRLAPIPNINIGQVYDQRYANADLHYEALGKLAGFFGRNMPVHYHDRFFQVHYVCNGEVRVFLGDRHYRQHGPMFFLTPPTVPHAFTTHPDSEGHVLTVRQPLIWPLLEPHQRLVPDGQALPVCVGIAELEPGHREAMHHVEALMRALGAEFAATRPGSEAARIALTQLIFIHLLRLSRHPVSAQPTRREDVQIFHRFNALIEQHYREHWPLPRYADKIGVSVARLNDICRRISGLPCKRLIFDRQLQEAKRLLLFTSASANQICYELGFKDPAYFSRFFARQSGMSPGEYRRREGMIRRSEYDRVPSMWGAVHPVKGLPCRPVTFQKTGFVQALCLKPDRSQGVWQPNRRRTERQHLVESRAVRQPKCQPYRSPGA